MEKRHKKKTNWLKRIFYVNKESRDIQKESFDFAKKESKRNFAIQCILVGLAIPTLIVAVFSLLGIIQLNLHVFGSAPLDYAINTTVSPSQIVLNENGQISFTFNFTNVGSKNITDFRVSRIIFYRDLDKLTSELFSLYSPGSNYYLDCTNPYNSFGSSSGVIIPSQSCTSKVIMYPCQKCFDDKEKTIHLFVYFESIPPLSNAVVNLTII